MSRLILAFQMLTRLPINVGIIADARLYAQAVVFYPVCALAVGLISVLAWFLGIVVTGSTMVGALLAAVASALVTGALHLDGLADTADGLLSSRSPERMLEIMKDSHTGVMGAMAIVFDIASRLIFVSIMGRAALLVLIIAPIAAKTAIACAAWSSPYARKQGLGQSVTEHTGKKHVLINTGLAVALCAAAVTALGAWGNVGAYFAVASPVLAAFLGMLLAKLVTRKLGGITGDILGAINEATELAVMFCALIWR